MFLKFEFLKEIHEIHSLPLDSSSPADIILMTNHFCRLDWFLYWGLLHPVGLLEGLKITMKDMRSVPFFGWTVYMMDSIMISRRDREKDLGEIVDKLKSHPRGEGDSMTLFIFPEGTDMGEESLNRSIEFQKTKMGRVEDEIWKNVLIPKAAGFHTALRTLVAQRGSGSGKSGGRKPPRILDFSIAIETPKGRINEKYVFWNGEFPKVINVRAKEWTDWEKRGLGEEEKCKEALLETFAEKNELCNPNPPGSFAGFKKDMFPVEVRYSMQKRISTYMFQFAWCLLYGVWMYKDFLSILFIVTGLCISQGYTVKISKTERTSWKTSPSLLKLDISLLSVFVLFFSLRYVTTSSLASLASVN